MAAIKEKILVSALAAALLYGTTHVKTLSDSGLIDWIAPPEKLEAASPALFGFESQIRSVVPTLSELNPGMVFGSAEEAPGDPDPAQPEPAGSTDQPPVQPESVLEPPAEPARAPAASQPPEAAPAQASAPAPRAGEQAPAAHLPDTHRIATGQTLGQALTAAPAPQFDDSLPGSECHPHVRPEGGGAFAIPAPAPDQTGIQHPGSQPPASAAVPAKASEPARMIPAKETKAAAKATPQSTRPAAASTEPARQPKPVVTPAPARAAEPAAVTSARAAKDAAPAKQQASRPTDASMEPARQPRPVVNTPAPAKATELAAKALGQAAQVAAPAKPQASGPAAASKAPAKPAPAEAANPQAAQPRQPAPAAQLPSPTAKPAAPAERKPSAQSHPASVQPASSARKAAGPKAAAPASGRRKVLLVGDSLMEQLAISFFRDQAKFPAKYEGLHFYSVAKFSTGIANGAYYDWPVHLREFLPKYKPDLVVFMMGANDLLPIRYRSGRPGQSFFSTAWKRDYAGIMNEMFADVRASGEQPYWVGLPVIARAQYAKFYPTLSAVQKNGCSLGSVPYFDCDTVLADEKGQFRMNLVLPTGHVVKIRKDDKTHMTDEGARLVNNALLPLLRKALGLPSKEDVQ